ncbi:proteasome ATPase [Micrococcales bacterium 31B]|nr:proteasome ATPase [Micrococcales bacterium 31B]
MNAIEPASYQDLRTQVQALSGQNERLVTALKLARQQIENLKQDLDDMGQPPNTFATFLRATEEGFAEVLQSGRKLRVAARDDVEIAHVVPGQEVLLNETLNIVAVQPHDATGEVVPIKELLPDGRIIVLAHQEEERVLRRAGALRDVRLRPGQFVMCSLKAGFALELVERAEITDLVLEVAPDIRYEDIGGLSEQIEQIKDAIEMPFLHGDLYREHGLKPPKGVLLYGPPGCGKTLIAKAVARSLAQRVADRNAAGDGANPAAGASEPSYFLNIKGPELLNKYVGETERSIRLIFARAREKASEGVPVVVFFDEMDSLFRTRGTGVSSDVETTIVPQLLAEIDGVESLENVIVIGASNREDMIDPAILRPGRLDVKIKIQRPIQPGAEEIFGVYLTPAVPVHAELVAAHGGIEGALAHLITTTVERMYAETPVNEYLEVTYAGGDKEVMYFHDFISGAMIQNVVDRAKIAAIKSLLATGERGLTEQHLLDAVAAEFRENEDLPNTTNPDDWARISGKKGERIVFIRSLIHTPSGETVPKSIDATSVLHETGGQYL